MKPTLYKIKIQRANAPVELETKIFVDMDGLTKYFSNLDEMKQIGLIDDYVVSEKVVSAEKINMGDVLESNMTLAEFAKLVAHSKGGIL